ncbi:MAG: hypothetical protein EBS41_02260 [Actinobacteria bacterium]|nr:hypothetical protein [Actinomycetota bacterium]
MTAYVTVEVTAYWGHVTAIQRFSVSAFQRFNDLASQRFGDSATLIAGCCQGTAADLPAGETIRPCV